MPILKRNVSIILASSAIACLLAMPASAQSLGGGVSVGGIGADAGASVGGGGIGADASVGLGGGTSVDADASIGGTDSADADASVSVGGVDADATANVGLGALTNDNTDADVSIGLNDPAGLTDDVTAGVDLGVDDNTVSIGVNEDDDGTTLGTDEAEDVASDLTANASKAELQELKVKCNAILGNTARFDADLVTLCRAIASVQR